VNLRTGRRETKDSPWMFSALIITESQRIADVESQNVTEVVEFASADEDVRIVDLRGGEEESRHGETMDNER